MAEKYRKNGKSGLFSIFSGIFFHFRSGQIFHASPIFFHFCRSARFALCSRPARCNWARGPSRLLFYAMGTVGRCHFSGLLACTKGNTGEHRYDRGGRGRRQQRGTDHILVHQNAATRKAAMHTAIFFTSQFIPKGPCRTKKTMT